MVHRQQVEQRRRTKDTEHVELCHVKEREKERERERERGKGWPVKEDGGNGACVRHASRARLSCEILDPSRERAADRKHSEERGRSTVADPWLPPGERVHPLSRSPSLARSLACLAPRSHKFGSTRNPPAGRFTSPSRPVTGDSVCLSTQRRSSLLAFEGGNSLVSSPGGRSQLAVFFFHGEAERDVSRE